MVGDKLAAAVLDAFPDATAVLDSSASIIAVNRAWRMFAIDNGGEEDRTGVGVNYLDLCERSAAAGCQDAHLAAEGLRAVLDGETVQSEIEYPCPSPTANRWFLLRQIGVVRNGSTTASSPASTSAMFRRPCSQMIGSTRGRMSFSVVWSRIAV